MPLSKCEFFKVFRIKLFFAKVFQDLSLTCVFCASGMMCIVKPDGPPQLCKTDEIGEICVSSRTGGMMYFGLAGVTKNTFEVHICYIFHGGSISRQICWLMDTLHGVKSLLSGIED